MAFAQNKVKLYIILIILILITILVILPYLRVEILTFMYYDEFADRYLEIGYFDDISVGKVYDYKPNESATVYYVDDVKEFGVLIYFKYRSSTQCWEMLTWKAVWSKYGSADDMIWPYYR